MTADPRDPADTAPHPTGPRPPVRRRAGWTYALGVSVAAFALWLVVDAPTLRHNAQTQPVGTRRTVALDVLGPLASLSRGLQLSHLVSVADGVIGHDGNQPGDGSGALPSPPPPSRTPRHHKGAPPPAPTTTTTTTTVPADPHPTAADPLRVLIVGDSLGIDLGDVLQNDLANTGVVAPTLDAVESTGLSRPDYFNWPVELQSDVAKDDPQVVVIMMGANDPQNFPGPPVVAYGTPQWNAIYAQRVDQFLDIATARGAQVIWVGMPPMQDPWRNAAMANLNRIVAAQAHRVRRVHFVSSWNLLGGPKGIYLPYIVVNGQAEFVREPDGTHISPDGGEVLSQAVITEMRTGLHIGVAS